jgi:hypothetical protein
MREIEGGGREPVSPGSKPHLEKEKGVGGESEGSHTEFAAKRMVHPLRNESADEPSCISRLGGGKTN